MAAASNPLDEHKARAQAWFEALRDDLCLAFERARGGAAGRGAARRPAGRPVRAHAVDAGRPGRRARRGRHHEPDRGPRVREGRHPHLHRARRVRARVPQADPRRRGRPALLGLGRVADRPSGQSERADGAHEHAHGRDHQMVVRRRRRPHARARPAAHAGRTRTPSPSTPPWKPRAGGTRSPTTPATRSGATSTSICRTARRCAASAASSTTT